jgi:hypothetical protein
MPAIKTWKTRPPYSVLLEILTKKGDMTDDDLFNQLKGEFDDIGYKDFNEFLLNLEVSGKIRTSSLSRGKRRVELVQ